MKIRSIAVMTHFARFTASMPDELNVWLIIRHAPPLPFLPESDHGEPIVALAVCYAGDPAVGEKLVVPLRAFGGASGRVPQDAMAYPAETLTGSGRDYEIGYR